MLPVLNAAIVTTVLFWQLFRVNKAAAAAAAATCGSNKSTTSCSPQLTSANKYKKCITTTAD
jgi:hypothetical protein